MFRRTGPSDSEPEYNPRVDIESTVRGARRVIREEGLLAVGEKVSRRDEVFDEELTSPGNAALKRGIPVEGAGSGIRERLDFDAAVNEDGEAVAGSSRLRKDELDAESTRSSWSAREYGRGGFVIRSTVSRKDGRRWASMRGMLPSWLFLYSRDSSSSRSCSAFGSERARETVKRLLLGRFPIAAKAEELSASCSMDGGRSLSVVTGGVLSSRLAA